MQPLRPKPRQKRKPVSNSTEIVADSRSKPKMPTKKEQELKLEAKLLDSAAKDLVLNSRVRNSEAEFKKEYERMLRYNSRLIRRLNVQLESTINSRDIYALSTLMSQQREVINDLRSITDLSGQVDLIYNQAITPFMSDLTQLITDVYYQLRKLIMETSKPKETQFALGQLDDLIKQIGHGMQASHGNLRMSVEGIMLGNQGTVKTKKSKRV